MRCCIFILGPFCSRRYFYQHFFDLDISLSINLTRLHHVFGRLVNHNFFHCLNDRHMNDQIMLSSLYGYGPYSIVSLHHMVLTNFHFNIKGHSYFLVPVVLHTNLSLYCLYFPPFSQLDITFFFISNFWITTTNRCSFPTRQAQFNKS